MRPRGGAVAPEAVAFAGHYDFDVDVLAAYRPTGKGVSNAKWDIMRGHIVAGHSLDSIDELDHVLVAWSALWRQQVHRTHGEVIGGRALRDNAALRPLPASPYLGDRSASAPGRQRLPGLVCRSLYSTQHAGSELVRPRRSA